jgi:hypothetical protein
VALGERLLCCGDGLERRGFVQQQGWDRWLRATAGSGQGRAWRIGLGSGVGRLRLLMGAAAVSSGARLGAARAAGEEQKARAGSDGGR